MNASRRRRRLTTAACANTHRGPTARVAILTALVAAACNTAPDVEVRDQGILWPTLRLEHPARSPDGVVRPRGRAGFTAEGDVGEGSFDGGAGHYRLLGGQLFAYAGTDPAAVVSARVLGGTEYLHLRTLLPAGAVTDDAFGAGLGLDVCCRVVDPLEAYARGTSALLLPDTASHRLEFGVRGAVVPEVELAIAFRRWRVRREDFSSGLGLGGADLDLAIEGIVLSLGVVF